MSDSIKHTHTAPTKWWNTKHSNLILKLDYAYILTPKGIIEKTKITKNFIIKKKQEYEKLKSYINEEI